MGCHHLFVGSLEIINSQEESDPTRKLLAHDPRLMLTVRRASRTPVAPPRGRTTTQRLGRPSFVNAARSSTSSKPKVFTKKWIAGS